MKLQKLITYTVIVALVSGVIPYKQNYIQAFIFDIHKTAYVMTTVAGVAATWALVERVKKNKMSHQLSKLSAEIEKFKNEQFALEQERNLLVSANKYLEFVFEEYEHEYALFQNNNVPYLESLLDLIHIRLSKVNNYEDLKKIFVKNFEAALSYKNQLDLKMLEWNTKAEKQKYIEQTSKLIDSLDLVISFLKNLKVIYEQQIDFIKLKSLEKNYDQKYAQEINIGKSYLNEIDKIEENDTTSQIIDRHIRSLYSQASEQFPYLLYGAKLKEDVDKLRKALSGFDNFKVQPFQEKVIFNVRTINRILETIFKYVVTTSKYEIEKRNKPEFDRKEQLLQAKLRERQERLNAELRERQAKLEQERYLIQAKLQEEKNIAQNLANQKAELELAHKNLEVREREMALELARIRDGETLKDAIAKNDRQWLSKYKSLEDDYKKIIKKASDLAAQIERTKKELSDLKNKIKSKETKEQQLALEIKELQDKVARALSSIKDMETSINPPFNPDLVDGLRHYINKMKSKVTVVRNILS